MTVQIKSYSKQLVHPVTLLSVSDGSRENIATMAWVAAVSSDPPLITVAVSPKRYSHELVETANEFAILILSDNQKELSTLAGTTSGRKVNKWEIEPFKKLRMEPTIIKSPLIKGCRASLECKLESEIKTGDHTLFIGKIVHSQFNTNVQPLILFDRCYFNLGNFIANYP
jgi:flavin reductase (DIM6/NTAB) family NADH-FMN oxidoreductase RutF